MNKIFTFFVLFFVILVLPVQSGIIFSDLDLSGDNRLLFKAGFFNQDATFLTSLGDPPRVTTGLGSFGAGSLTAGSLTAGSLAPGSLYAGSSPALRLLTAFPEKIDLLENGRILQIRNSFGVMRLPLTGGLPVPVPGIPSFEGGILAGSGRAGEVLSSPDGRWILYLKSVSPALGDLVLLDLQTGINTLIASRLDRPETVFPASWSPDSRFFLYERDGNLFFYMTGSSLMPADEKLRLVGEGKMSSISWGRGGDFYYLRGSTVYQVRGPELFARTLYADFLAIGAVMGKIPLEFDPCFDNFWMAPDRQTILVSKGRRSLFYFPMGNDASTRAGSETLQSYLVLPRSCSDINAFWPADGKLTIFISIREDGNPKVNVWRINGNSVFETLPSVAPASGSQAGTGFSQGAVSPDGSLALFWGTGGILLYDYSSWRLIETISGTGGVSCVWEGNDTFITGDEYRIDRIRLRRSAVASRVEIIGRELLCLSRINQANFEDNSSRILAKNGDSWFVSDGRNRWMSINSPRPKTPSQVSAQYRVYLEPLGFGVYDNLPMIRNITSVGTFSLFPVNTATGVSRSVGAGEIALCFDLYDDDRGLPETLDALNRFGVKATFFLNGEFIRRHPLAVKDIVAAGHEAASMFFALIDLADVRYRADTDFITRGLARNEDEFYKVTGKELSLFWHPPWYTASPFISAASARANYSTVQRDLDPMDWVSVDDEKTLGLKLRSPSEMVDYILANSKSGAVIPVRLGLLSGGRNDYLFNRINVLIDALIREGYTIKKVSGLNLR